MNTRKGLLLLVLSLASVMLPQAAMADGYLEKVWYPKFSENVESKRIDDPESHCLVELQPYYPRQLIFIDEWRWGSHASCIYIHHIHGGAKIVKQYMYLYKPVSCPPDTLLFGGECLPVVQARSDNGSCDDCDDGVDLGVGNPINTATGNKYQRENDYPGTVAGSLRFDRYYNSKGDGWTFAFQRNIELLTHYSTSDDPDRLFSARALVTRDDGREIPFFIQMDDSSGTLEVPEGEFQGPSWSEWRLFKTVDGYELHNRDGSLERYSESGELLEIVAMDGQVSSLQRNGDVTTITDPQGRQLVLHVSSSGLVTQVQLPGGDSITYGYANGQLASVTWPDNSTRNYLYNGSRLTGIIDANGDRFATYAYDFAGRAIMSTHAGGAGRVDVTYPLGYTASTNASGATETRQFTEVDGRSFGASLQRDCLGCGSGERRVIRDSAGRPVEVIDHDGSVTRYSRNARGFVTSRTEAAGSAQQRTVTTEWHPEFRLPLRITEPGKRTEHVYDENGHRLATTVTDTASGESRTTRWTRNEFGQPLTVDGPRDDVDDVTRYAYDAQGNLLSLTNALGHVTRYTEHDAHGKPLRIVDPNGVVTELAYDLRQRLVSRTVAAGTPDAATTSFTYDAVGQLVETLLPNGASIAYEYDAAHRLVAIADTLGNRIDYTLDAMGNRVAETVSGPDGSVFRESSAEYDALNRLVASVGGENQRVEYAYDDAGNRTAIIDAHGNPTRNRYDVLDRLFETVDALGGVTSYTYDPRDNLTQVIDPRGVTTGYTYNGFGELLRTDSPDAGSTVYEYDAAGNRSSQVDARGIRVEYRYDALGRLVTIDYPADAAGNDNKDIHYEYDQGANGIGRLTAIVDESGRTDYHYGPRGDLVSKLSSIDPGSDAPDVFLPVDYEHDLAGNISALRYPSGINVEYRRDAAGRVTGMELLRTDGTRAPIVSGLHHAAFGPVTELTYGNGLVETRNFDRDGRIRQISLPGILERAYTWDATNNIVRIDDALATADSQAFDYDALYRLVAARTGDAPGYGNLEWQYDAVGNRSRQDDNGSISDYRYEPDSNRLSGVDDVTYEYDAAGNTLADGDNSYRYDQRNRLVNANGDADYLHNALGQRVRKLHYLAAAPGDADGDGLITESDLHVLRDILRGNAAGNPAADCNQDGAIDNADTACIARQIGDAKNNGKERGNGKGRDAGVSTTITATASSGGVGPIIGQVLFIYDEAGHLIGEYDETGQRLREYLWLGDRPVAMLTEAGMYYIHVDHLNTPQVLTDASQAVAWQARYSPFGEAEVDTAAQVQFNLRFPGQFADAETGLNYNYFRSYNPATGRYTQSDPLGLDDGPNTYSYVRNRPTYFIDPLGLSSCGAEGGRVFPSDFGTYSFESACQSHDSCYATCGASKKACDRKFWGDMTKECRTKIPPHLGNLLHRCLILAKRYFDGVDVFGDAAYKKAQENCKGCES